MKKETGGIKTKSAIDLFLLGLLLDGQRNAYELAQFIASRHLDKLLKISQPALYKNCKRLYRSGLLDGKRIRSGQSPEKVAYAVNKAGREHFHRLMAHFSAEVKPFYFEHNSFLWGLEKLEEKEGLAMLAKLQTSMAALKNWLVAHEKEVTAHGSFGAKALVRQYRMVMETMTQWIAKTMDEYKTLVRKGVKHGRGRKKNLLQKSRQAL